jgi:Protein of unknown function (DUF3025)
MKPIADEIAPSSQAVFASLRGALQQPCAWLTPFERLAEKCAQSKAQSVAAALNNLRGETAPVTFVDQSLLPATEPYEAFIARTLSVPTRDNLHDLFNGFMWLTFPQSKHRMNGLHAHEIARQGISGSRGPVRDALTVFDENGALLQAPIELTDALRQRDWHALFVSHRALWESARLILFGHALLEKLLQPRKNITAHVWLMDEISDESFAACLVPEKLTTKSFLPLPVLGVPGWWCENERPEFYDDADVFRPPR